MRNKRYERGVALLFALGVLSLMLVSGLAFLGNSLISQKIAVNSSEFNITRQLARNAANRAMAQLAMFNLLQSAYHDETGTFDASRIYSSLRYSEGQNSTATGMRNDTLATKLLLPNLSEDAAFDGYGRYSRAKWLYVYDNGTVSDDAATAPAGTPTPKIIGRYAYQVIPQTSRSRLSLYAVTAGAKGIAGGPVNPTSQNRKIPHIHRWGVDVDELLIPGLLDRTNGPNTGLFGMYWGDISTPANIEAPQYELDNFFNLFSSTTSPNHLSVNDNLTKNYKSWLRNIFSDGKGRLAREAYSDNGTPVRWYPRFNLGRFDNGENWYERFIKGSETVSTVQNNATVIERLSSHPGNNLSIDGGISSGFTFKDGYEDDSRYDPFGLPFLRRIGNNAEKGAFETLENLRKQIAANLNDYCDEDSIPTSDQPAESWVDESSGKVIATAPSYTGNEKTPYINEIAFGFMLSGAEFVPESSSVYNYQANLSAEIIAELIRVYKEVKEDITTAKLYGKINSLGLTFKVSLKGKISGSYTDESGTPKSFEDQSLTYDDTVSVAAVPIEIKDKTFIVDFSSGVVANAASNYWLKNDEFVKESDAQKVKVNLYPKLKAAVADVTGDKDISNISIKLEGVKVEIDKMTFNLGDMALTMKVKKNGADITSGVDFVKFKTPPAASEYFCVKPSAVSEKTAGSGGTLTLSDVKSILHAGVMQAIDPRQNLIADFERVVDNESKNINASDWYLSGTHEMTETTPDTTWVWETLKSRFSSGKVNKCSVPKECFYAGTTDFTNSNKRTDCDIEQAEDPAWQGDLPGEHISTAVIRNAPMRSPWELGFIHRGIPFQTINLKKAGGIENNGTGTVEQELADGAHLADNFDGWSNAAGTGTSYEHGDAGILDQIKMTPYNKSYGKVDMEALTINSPWWYNSGTTPNLTTKNLALFQSLFNNIRRQQPEEFLAESISDDQVLHNAGVLTLTGTPYPLTNVTALPAAVTSSLRSKILLNNSSHWVLAGDTTDAAKEELVGKTFNLIEGRSFSPPNVFRILVVAQSIRDLEGSLSRWDFSVTPNALRSRTASFGVFDYDSANNLYYDDIMGECRMLVTVEKVHYMDGSTPRARLRVKQIEYLD